MKLLSIAIPCYNSEAYMRNCIESLLPGGDEVEILIVDDGSVKDNTAQIADEYEARYPGICRAIHQENGGHGEAVNAGLRAATGIYFKVVDSDDWVNAEAYKEVLETLRSFVMGEQTLDMLITNFVYEKQGAKHKRASPQRRGIDTQQRDGLFSRVQFARVLRNRHYGRRRRDCRQLLVPLPEIFQTDGHIHFTAQLTQLF